MKKPIKETIHAKGIDINIYTIDFENEYVSLTDIARYRSIDPRVTIHNWLRARDIVEFLGLWEALYNPNFKRIEFDTFNRMPVRTLMCFLSKNGTRNWEPSDCLQNLDDTEAEFMHIWI